MTKHEALDWFTAEMAKNPPDNMMEAYRLAERALRRSIRATRAVKKNAIEKRKNERR